MKQLIFLFSVVLLFTSCTVYKEFPIDIYKPGEALFVNASYSQKGLGVLISAKRVDNMSFRADRTANLANLSINYLPDITKNHTYSLAAMYPYATQLNGESGVNTEITKKFEKNSVF